MARLACSVMWTVSPVALWYSSSIPTAEVHAAAGPGDHWWYLLANGGTSKCNGQAVSGVGVQNAMKIMYNAMLMKTSSASYLKYRTWTLTAAKNLDTTCALFNSTKAAWNAVNVPAQTGDPTCGGTTTTPPTKPGRCRNGWKLLSTVTICG